MTVFLVDIIFNSLCEFLIWPLSETVNQQVNKSQTSSIIPLYFRTLDAANEDELRLRITLSPHGKDDNSEDDNKEKSGLNQPVAILLMVMWYLFSALNLFANKYIISYLNGEPALLGNENRFKQFFIS